MEASEAEAKTMSIAVSDVKKRVDREDGFEKEETYLMVNEEKDSSSLDCLLSCRAPKAADCLYNFCRVRSVRRGFPKWLHGVEKQEKGCGESQMPTVGIHKVARARTRPSDGFSRRTWLRRSRRLRPWRPDFPV